MSINERFINGLLQLNDAYKISLLNTEEEVKWFPILNFENPKLIIGVLQDGRWVVEGNSNCLFTFSEPKSYIRVMSLLERPSNIIYEKLENISQKLNLEIGVYDIFPFVEIIKLGLEQGSEYWAELAIKWIENLPVEKKVYLKESLVGVTNAKWASQKLRHKAMKEVAQLNM